jgi:hypothetical protein
MKQIMCDAHAGQKKQNKNESELKHMSPLHHQNLTDWTYKWICNLWYKYCFSNAAIDEIYLENNVDSVIVRKAYVMYSVWTCEGMQKDK